MKRSFIYSLVVILLLLSACGGSEPAPAREASDPKPAEREEAQQHSLVLIAEPSEGGQVLPGDGQHDDGAQVLLNAIPSQGYVFEGWFGDASGTGNTVAIQMDSNKTITARFSQLPTATPQPPPTATPEPCRRPEDVTLADTGNLIEVCGEVTNWGNVPCPACAYGGYSFLKLDGYFLVISYDWVFNNNWIGNCLVMADTVEKLGDDPVFIFGKGEGYAGSECTVEEDGTQSCSGGDYFLYWEGCE